MRRIRSSSRLALGVALALGGGAVLMAQSEPTDTQAPNAVWPTPAFHPPTYQPLPDPISPEARATDDPTATTAPPPLVVRCDRDPGITLPPGFCATIFADNLGHARHLVVADDGTVYVNTWSGRYFRTPPPDGGFLIGLKDRRGDGHASQIVRFGPGPADGATGGTGVALWHGGLYAEAGDQIVRYDLVPGQIAPISGAHPVLSELPQEGDHPMHPFAIGPHGDMFVNSGSETNACQVRNRVAGSPGQDPCVELEMRAGVWLYRADHLDQVFSAGDRYATGLRNTGGITFDGAGRVYAVQHGRDQLAQNWPRLYTQHDGDEEPGEELVALSAGADYGWPACYYDRNQARLVLAPEYGGNGGGKQGLCGTRQGPVASFPAHWAPNDVLAYTARAFPSAWRDGVFVAFHGSWNRSPGAQDGYLVGFQPLRDGHANGPFRRFADGFAGPVKDPGHAAFRPAGLALGPDGALFVADDVHGRIWRIVPTPQPRASDGPLPDATQSAGRDAPVRTTFDTAPAPVARPLPPAPTSYATELPLPRRGRHHRGGYAAATGPLPKHLPLGFTRQQIALGAAIFQNGCASCHGTAGEGTSQAPALTGPTWLWGSGTVANFAKAVRNGINAPRGGGGGMPAGGGMALTEKDIIAVSGYVWTLGHRGK